MTTHHTDEKKPPSLVARWKSEDVDRERKAYEKALHDRGEWGYIPPGCVFVPKKWLVTVQICLVVIMLSNALIMATQIYRYFEKKSQLTKTVAIVPHTAATSAVR